MRATVEKRLPRASQNAPCMNTAPAIWDAPKDVRRLVGKLLGKPMPIGQRCVPDRTGGTTTIIHFHNVLVDAACVA